MGYINNKKAYSKPSIILKLPIHYLLFANISSYVLLFIKLKRHIDEENPPGNQRLKWCPVGMYPISQENTQYGGVFGILLYLY